MTIALQDIPLNDRRRMMRLQLAARPDPEAGPRQWVACLGVGELMALPTPEGKRSFEVTEQYLRRAVFELDRYYSDLRSAGSSYVRPIIVEHKHDEYEDELEDSDDRSGRRSGDILAATVRPFDPKSGTADGPLTLFLLCEWRHKAWQAIQDGELEHISITILPNWTDKKSGISYAPFIYELSETTTPVANEFSLNQTLDPAVLAEVGLMLADTSETTTNTETDMDPEQIQQLVAQILDERLAEFTAKIDEHAVIVADLLSRIEALEGGEGEGEGEEGEGEGEGLEAGDDVQLADAGEEGDDADAGTPDISKMVEAAVAKALKPMAKMNEAVASLSDRVEQMAADRKVAAAYANLKTRDGGKGNAPDVKLSDREKKAKSVKEKWEKAEAELRERLGRDPSTKEVTAHVSRM